MFGELGRVFHGESCSFAYLDDAPEVTSPLECFSPGDSDDLQQVMDAETFAFSSENAFQVDRMVSILKVLLDTALDLQKATDNCLKPVILKASEGIKSLPDELLALILNRAGRLYGAEEVVRLSHVSRRFRAVALGGAQSLDNPFLDGEG